MILNILKLLLFTLSMAGYVLYIEKKFKIQVEFIPIISISMLTVILFFAGILNILHLVTILLFLIGIFYFIYEVWLNLQNKTFYTTLKKYITPGIILFGIMNVVFLLILNDQRLIHYDNFSHWAVIVKDILMDDALPNFEDVMVTFNSYPPGSALFVYYFSKIVGVSEGLALYSQMIIILSSVLSLFSFSSFEILSISIKNKLKIKKILLTILTIFVSLLLLNGPSSIRDLLVDTLISVVGISLFALMYFYIDSPKKIWLPISFISSFLTLIKNSGMFFALLALTIYMYMLYRYFKQHKVRKDKNYFLFLPLTVPLMSFYFWSRHVDLVYSSDQLGKHAMNINNYIEIFNEKSISEIQSIISVFVNSLIDNFTVGVIVMLLLVFGLVTFNYIINKKADRRLIVIFMAILAIFIFYNLGLLIMYLVSMPTAESLFLAGYTRYMETVMNFLVGVFTIGILYYLNKQELKFIYIVPSSILLLFYGYIALGGNNFQDTKNIFQREHLEINYINPTFANIDKSLSHLPDNPMRSLDRTGSFLLYYPSSDDMGYTNFYLRYRLFTRDTTVIKEIDELDQLWDYDFLSIAIIDDEVKNIFNTFSSIDPELNTYKIDKENKKIIEKDN